MRNNTLIIAILVLLLFVLGISSIIIYTNNQNTLGIHKTEEYILYHPKSYKYSEEIGEPLYSNPKKNSINGYNNLLLTKTIAQNDGEGPNTAEDCEVFAESQAKDLGENTTVISSKPVDDGCMEGCFVSLSTKKENGNLITEYRVAGKSVNSPQQVDIYILVAAYSDDTPAKEKNILKQSLEKFSLTECTQ